MREYLKVDDFLDLHRDPATGRRRISRDSVYEAIRTGSFPHVRIGRRVLVPSDALDLIATPPSDSSTRSDVASGTAA